jgi:hypothetical protein
VIDTETGHCWYRGMAVPDKVAWLDLGSPADAGKRGK